MGPDVVSRKRLAREKSLPEIPRSLGEEVISSLGAMREQVERLSGKAGDASDRAVRLFEVEMGLLSAFVPTPADVSMDAVPGGGGLRILKSPRDLRYEHQVFGIKVAWVNVEEKYSAVEIWVAEDSLLLSDARRVGLATKPMAEWTMHGISMRVSYTFWIRAVDWSGGVSPWCPPQGQGGLIVPAEIDTTIGEVLGLLTGQVTESHLYQGLSSRIDLIDGPATMEGSVAALLEAEGLARASADSAMAANITTLQTTVGGHAAAIQEQAQVVDGLEAQWFIKLDVDGRVTGVGLHGTGATSEFVVLADKFMVVTPGESPKVPFVVGPLGETGTTGVGVDGNLVVNGTIMARHLDAGSVAADKIAAEAVTAEKIAAGGVTAEKLAAGSVATDHLAADAVTTNKIAANAITAGKISAEAINGTHISSASLISLQEGGKLIVGQNNIILDSVSDRLVVAPNNGVVGATPDYAGVDYAMLQDGDISFMYWNSSNNDHVNYKSLRRVEVGSSVVNGTTVTLPGVWKSQPKIIVSPAELQVYAKAYSGYDQTLICRPESITKSGLTYTFIPKAYLRLTNGGDTRTINLSARVDQNPTPFNTTTSANTISTTTAGNVTSLTVSGVVSGEAWGIEGGLKYSSDLTVTLYLIIDSTQYTIGTYTAKNTVANQWAFSKTVSGMSASAKTYYLKVEHKHGYAVYRGAYYSAVIADSEIVAYNGTVTVLATGSLNYVAIGA